MIKIYDKNRYILSIESSINKILIDAFSKMEAFLFKPLCSGREDLQ